MMKQWIQSALIIAGLAWSTASVAQVDDENLAQGENWYNRMHQALRELNFDAAFVHVRGQRVEPYRWLHGRSENGQEIEVLSGLNGPEFKALRHNNQSSYYHPMGSPYSMQSSVINGPIPAGFFHDYGAIRSAYNVVSVGGGRIIDRAAQHIRVIARDQRRYGYSIWLDKETGMLLRSATLSSEGDVLEQIQLTSLFITDEFPQNLRDLEDITPPPLVQDNSNRESVQGDWQLTWLPEGFELKRSNHHQMAVTGAQADYFLYSDGLAEFSVYISEQSATRGPLQIDGPESLFSTELGNYRVTVVGRLPFEIVQRIARGVQGQP